MPYLIDTSILGRLANAADTNHGLAKRSLFELHQRNEAVHLTPQVLVEFRNVATRSVALNGLGLSTAAAEAEAADFEAKFSLVAETPAIFNIAHFTRMAAFGPGLVVVDPASV